MALKVFNAILVLIHVIFDIYSEARRLFRYASQHLVDFYFGPWGLKAELDYVRRSKAPLSKPLSHIVVILGSEVVSIKDIVRIALWSHAAGASYVSFYDHSGEFNAGKQLFNICYWYLKHVDRNESQGRPTVFRLCSLLRLKYLC